MRALSRYTESLVEEVRGLPVAASFPTYSDLSAFTALPVAPLPERPTALFIGMLEAYKNVDGLADAWREVAKRLPEARLVLVGKGARHAVIDQLVADLPDRVEHVPELAPDGVAARLDQATVLVAALAVGGPGPRRDRGVRAGPRCRREPRRRHPRPRPRRRRGPADRAARRRRARRGARRGALRPRSSRRGTAPRRSSATANGTRPRRSSPRRCEASSRRRCVTRVRFRASGRAC